MSDTLTEQQAAEFRQKCVDFMEQFAPGQNPTLDDQKAFLAAAAEAGLAGLPVPTEYGGGGLTLAHEKIWREVKGNYPMPDSEFIISHGMCMPMLAEYGTDDRSFKLRAERAGTGDGRVYTIQYSATDDSDNVSTAGLDVIVLHGADIAIWGTNPDKNDAAIDTAVMRRSETIAARTTVR